MKFVFFFFNDTATTEIYTLSLHDALPISRFQAHLTRFNALNAMLQLYVPYSVLLARETFEILGVLFRSEEHTSELQSRSDLVCRLLLEKKNTRRCRI